MQSFMNEAQIYAHYHQDPLTRYAHLAGVPLIILALMILFGFVRIVIIGVIDFSFANILFLALLVYYFLLEWRLALTLTPIFIFLLWIANLFNYMGPTEFSVWSFVIIFLVGVTMLVIGHIVDGKKPAFLDSLKLILIAPLCLVAELFFMAGWMPALKEAMYPQETIVEIKPEE